jgi:PPK2 family polyphosphate:nucleotide phosphotransferase
VVLQGLDTSGKDGVIRKVFGPLNPQGVKVAAFKQPTQKELDHDFLWRIHSQTPGAGEITVFNRSHYEDVLAVRVHDLVSPEKCRQRYQSIREFERTLANEGTTVVKFFLCISKGEQKARLQARLDNPDKHWKFSPTDLKERSLWEDYRKVYAETITETSTEDAPWYCVPSDRKWYRDLVIAGVVLRKLESLGMKYPDAPEGLDLIRID